MRPSKGNLAQHKRQAHEGVRYPCRQCSYQATSKENLTKHKRLYMKKSNIPAHNATIKQIQRGLWNNTKRHCMKELDALVTLVANVKSN